jgi:hypothetical protein
MLSKVTFMHLQQMTKMLKNLDHILEKAAAHADHRKFDVNNMTQLRLAPDMFNLTKQVQITADTAKFFASHLSGQTAPAFEDTEKTWTELRERLKKTMAYLQTFTPESFANVEKAKVAPKWADGKWLTAEDYIYTLAVPNFYFHHTAAYALIRQAGVEIGKFDFIGDVNFQK